jgi:dienelactone hydrolase
MRLIFPPSFSAARLLRAVMVFGCLLCQGWPMGAQTVVDSPAISIAAPSWQVQTLATGRSVEGQAATLGLATLSPAAIPVRHVLLYFSSYSVPMLRVDGGATPLRLNIPWISAAPELNGQGIAVVFFDTPSDVNKRTLAARSSHEVASDMDLAVQHVKQQFPGTPIHLVGFSLGAGQLLDAASGLRDVGRVVIASGDFRDVRHKKWSAYQHPVMLLHAPGAQCDSAPFLEAEWVATVNHFSLVQVGYAKQEPRANCGAGSQHIFAQRSQAFGQTVARWLDGAEPPASIGAANPAIAWREQLLHYSGPAMFGTHRLEMTLLYPQGAGPYPVAVFNHGDMEIDSAHMRSKNRFVDRTVAREFLQQGWAVAFPTRRGVGLSEGHYPQNFQAGDGDATYKARIHAEDILPALEYLKTLPEIDGNRILVTGQSAGGFAAMHVASLSLPGVVGLVNFSGGRTDMLQGGAAGYLNRTMVRGFGEWGASIRIPSLWIFAENDSRYSANTVRAAHTAFTKAGGTAALFLNPPIHVDGHFIYHQPELWRKALQEYLVGLNGVPVSSAQGPVKGLPELAQ